MKAVLYSLLCLSPLGLAAAWIWWPMSPEYGLNASSVSWLPPEASDISYYRVRVAEAYEFRISKDGFKHWAQEQKWTLKAIEQPMYVDRFVRYLPREHPSSKEQEWDTAVSSGVYFVDRRSNGGGVTVAFDDARSKAFYSWTAR